MATAGTGTPVNAGLESSSVVTSPIETLPAANISSTPRQASPVDWPSRSGPRSALIGPPMWPGDLHGAAAAAAARAARVHGHLVGEQRDAGRGGRVQTQQVALL